MKEITKKITKLKAKGIFRTDYRVPATEPTTTMTKSTMTTMTFKSFPSPGSVCVVVVGVFSLIFLFYALKFRAKRTKTKCAQNNEQEDAKPNNRNNHFFRISSFITPILSSCVSFVPRLSGVVVQCVRHSFVSKQINDVVLMGDRWRDRKEWNRQWNGGACLRLCDSGNGMIAVCGRW